MKLEREEIKKIVVINGSPKGDLSITLQYMRFFQNLYPEYSYSVFNVTQKIKILEKKPERMKEIIDEMKNSDLIVWSFPLYYMLVNSGLKRFIELLFVQKAKNDLDGKKAAAISTSIKFYDHTAHNYIHAISEDLGMSFVAAASFHMRDLINKKTRINVEAFFHHLNNVLNTSVRTIPRFKTLEPTDCLLTIAGFNKENNLKEKDDSRFDYLEKELVNSMKNLKISIITDINDQESTKNQNLKTITDFLEYYLPGQVQRIDINDVDIKSHCMGCLRCGYNSICLFHEKDGYFKFAEEYLKQADLIFIASPMQDHYLTARWQNVIERFFYNCHTPSLNDKYIAHVITGPITQEINVQEICISIAEMHDATHVGFISDNFQEKAGNTEEKSPDLIKEILLDEIKRILYMIKNKTKIHTYRREGGRRIFRDEIYGGLNMVFQIDHKGFKKQKIYKTFPQKSMKFNMIISFFMRILQKIPSFRKKMRSEMPKYMVMPYQRTLKHVKKK